MRLHRLVYLFAIITAAVLTSALITRTELAASAPRFSPAPASLAQTAPPGSYQQSCKKKEMFYGCPPQANHASFVADPAQSIFKSLAQAAQTLYNAWRMKDRDRALYVSNAETVEKLFSVRRRRMVFKGCHKREEGDFECLYEDRKNDITLAMLTLVRRRGYVIGSVSFSGEAQ